MVGCFDCMLALLEGIPVSIVRTEDKKISVISFRKAAAKEVAILFENICGLKRESAP